MPVPTSPPPPPFTLETVLEILEAPSKVKKDLIHQDSRRLELRQRCKALASKQQGQLPRPTPGIQSAWNSVLNVELRHKPVWGLQCRDVKCIAEALLALQILDDRRFGETMTTFASQADASVAFALKMAGLVAECLHIRWNSPVAEEVRRSVCASELKKLQQFWAPDDSGTQYISPSFGVRGWSRLVFFGALFDNRVATVSDYAHVLAWLTLGGTPCTFRLKAVKVAVECCDKRVQTLCGADASLVIDALRTTGLGGDKTWMLGGHLGAAKMLRDIRSRTDLWKMGRGKVVLAHK